MIIESLKYNPALMVRLIHDGSLFYFLYIVKKFTPVKKPLRPKIRFYTTYDTSCYTRKMGRAVRRVHIMPWATPIRRIGKTRKGYLCPDNYASYKESGYGYGVWFLLLNNITNSFHFDLKTSINNENSKAFSLLIKRRNDGGMAWMAKDQL